MRTNDLRSMTAETMVVTAVVGGW